MAAGEGMVPHQRRGKIRTLRFTGLIRTGKLVTVFVMVGAVLRNTALITRVHIKTAILDIDVTGTILGSVVASLPPEQQQQHDQSTVDSATTILTLRHEARPPGHDDATRVIQIDTKNSSSFTIIILTMNRFDSLHRLIKSLQATDYQNDNVNLIVRFDRPQNTTPAWLNQVASFKERLLWSAGTADIIVATQNMGPRQAWLTAWQPTSNTDQAIMFEDNISTVSPVWYKRLRGAERHYSNRTDMAGISLQRQKLVPLKSAIQQNNTWDIANDSYPLLHERVGSRVGGFAPRASVWQQFLDFANCTLETNPFVVETPEPISSDRYLHRFDQRTMWTQLFTWYTTYMDLYTLHLFSPQQPGAHWRKDGEHFQPREGKELELTESVDSVYPTDLLKLGWDTKPVTPKRLLRTVVMSGAVGYDAKTFERFCKTLRHHYRGDIVLLVSNKTTQDIQSLLNHYEIKTVPTSRTGGVRKSKGWYEINYMRWQFYESTCQHDKYDLCMAVDFRDILFQDDPFRNMLHQEGAVAYVYEHNLIMNKWHLEEASKCKQDNRTIANKMIINAGGLVGTPAFFPRLSAIMLNLTSIGCDDQVALNMAIHGEMINATTIHRHQQGHGSINNVAWGGVFRRDSRLQYLNRNCFPAPVVHQFDVVNTTKLSNPSR